MVDWLKVAAATGRAINTTASNVTGAIARSQVTPSWRAQRTGVLAPGDPPPFGPTATWLDYRAVALPRYFKGAVDGVFGLGRLVHPQRGSQQRMRLGWEVVRRHVAVAGPSGSGKTANVFVPWIVDALETGIPVVAVDVKGDLLQLIRAELDRRNHSKLGVPVFHWDIMAPTESRPWNPLAELTSAGIAPVVTALLGEVSPADPNRFFAERDHRWMRGLLQLSLAAGGAVRPLDLYGMVVSQARLVSAVRTYAASALDLADLVQYPPDDFARATSGLANRLAWLADPQLRDLLSGSGPRRFTLDEFLASNGLLVVGSRLAGGEAAAAAGALALNLLRMRHLSSFASGPHRPVMWLLDEAATYADRIHLAQLLDVVRSANVAVVVGLQDVTQFGEHADQARHLANCQGLICLSHCSAATAGHLSGRLGQHDAPSGATQLDGSGRVNLSVNRVRIPVLGEREIMYPPIGRYGGVAHFPVLTPQPWLFSFDAGG